VGARVGPEAKRVEQRELVAGGGERLLGLRRAGCRRHARRRQPLAVTLRGVSIMPAIGCMSSSDAFTKRPPLRSSG
jgi:hypothetical protein